MSAKQKQGVFLLILDVFYRAELRKLGYGVSELRSAGYGAGELRKLGYGAGELIHAGYSQAEVNAAFSKKAK